ILFTGSSQAYRSFDPRVFASAGFNIFTSGSNSQAPLNGYFLLHAHRQHLKPRLVVMEASYEMFASDAAESAIDMASNAAPSVDMIRMAIATKSMNVVLFALSRLFAREERYEVSDPKVQLTTVGCHAYISGGFCSWTLAARDFKAPPPKPLVVNNDQVKYFFK